MGLATAQLLASRGALLSLADVNESALQTAITTLNRSTDGAHMYRVVDVRQSSAVNEWIEATVSQFGRLDCAVNMAGIIKPAASVAETTDEAWDQQMAVNARGVFACTRAQLQAMQQGSGTGSIVSPFPLAHHGHFGGFRMS